MMSKSGLSYDPEFMSCPARKTPFLSTHARGTIAASLITYLVLSQMLTRWTATFVAPVAPEFHLVQRVSPPSLPTPSAPPNVRDRFVQEAPRQIDECVLFKGRFYIDERIVINPYEETDLRTAAVVPPAPPGSPTIARTARPTIPVLPKSPILFLNTLKSF